MRLRDKRVLVTQADTYMGPATVERFESEGAEVLADSRDLTVSGACEALVAEAGEVDVLIANLAAPNWSGVEVEGLADEQWHVCFDRMVHPLFALTRAVLPQMKARGRGKIVVYGSATALKGARGVSAYSAARAAQAGFVRAVGAEVARARVNVNLIAQNWVQNPSYYPPEVQADERFQRALRNQVPAGRLAKAWEDAALAVFLASDESDYFVGRVIPFDGGWSD